MANISITLECNMNCPHCFAKATQVETKNMSREVFLESLDFLERSGIKQVRLLGGEPTLHPDFDWFLAQILARKLPLFLFSNGFMPKATLKSLEKFTPENLSILINANPLEQSFSHINKKLEEVFRRFNRSVKLGYTIRAKNPNLDFLTSLIEKYSLKKSIRLGLANPCLNSENDFLPAKDYKAIGNSIYEFYLKIKNKHIQIDFDCGFVACMFPEDFLIVYLEKITNSCGAIPDILPDGSVISCYPLASFHRLKLIPESTAKELNERLDGAAEMYRNIGIFPECSTCQFKASNLCSGGCLTLAMKRLHSCEKNGFEHESITFQNCELETREDIAQKKFVIPYVDQPPEFWQHLHETYGKFIRAVYFPMPGNILGSGRPPQPHQHLESFLRLGLFQNSVLLNPITLDEPAHKVASPVIEALERFHEKFGLAEATVSNLLLARRIKEKLPWLELTASTLMEISKPNQILMLGETCNTVVPSNKIMRDFHALKELKQSFHGNIRLLVNEACLPGCPFRTQHFHEMAHGKNENPPSLCNDLLEQMPWMRLTGAWVLPQHLHLYDGVYDELKLAGRVTLHDPKKYQHVLESYIYRKPLMPHEIGGGPASVLLPIEVSEALFKQTLYCNYHCESCDVCQDYYNAGVANHLKV